MSIERLKTAVTQAMSRVESIRGKGEQPTKHSLVLPIVDALGYDTRNPDEVSFEHSADATRNKKAGQNEKVDIAILREGKPVIYIEVKALDIDLKKAHDVQLARYFDSSDSGYLGILTNGVQWLFYTHTASEKKLMDKVPFLELTLTSVSDAGSHCIEELNQFSKDEGFSSGAKVEEYAVKCLHTQKITTFLRKELDSKDGLSDEFITWTLKTSGVYNGKVVESRRKSFKPIIETALNTIKFEIGKRAIAGAKEASAKPSLQAASSQTLKHPIALENTEANGKLELTEEKQKAFFMVKSMFDASPESKLLIFDPSQQKEVPVSISCKDTTAYLSVLLNGKVTWWPLRLQLDGKTKWLGLNLDDVTFNSLPESVAKLSPTTDSEFRIKLESVDELVKFKDIIIAAFRKTIQDRKP